MKVSAPHFLLYSQTQPGPRESSRGQWRFVLQAADGTALLEAADEEPATGQRLELLAIVRGLEALDQPSRVTLVTGSRYVSRGIRFGLAQWREDGWQWERYGEMSPIKDHDLWRRVDQALQYHVVECRSRGQDGCDDLAFCSLRLAEPPADDAQDESSDVRIVQRRHRGKLLRFDPSEMSRPKKPPPGRAGWLPRLVAWLKSWRKSRKAARH